MKVSSTRFRPSVHCLGKHVVFITGANTKEIDQTPFKIFGRKFRSSDRVSVELLHNVHPYDLDMSFVIKMDQNDAASMAVDMRLNKTENYDDCLYGAMYPIGEEREAVKLFKLITQNMKQWTLYDKCFYPKFKTVYYK